MTIAYLLLVHEQPNHVGRLVRALQHDGAWFFIHVDRKTPIAPFYAAVPKSDRVTFIPRRHRANWGGWSVSAATLELCRAALAHEEHFPRLQLLSGSCYPIKPNEHILRILGSSNSEFISINDRVEPGSEFFRWVGEYHNRDLRSRRLEELLVRRLLNRYVKRRIPSGLAIHKGWQWWALTREAVEYVLRHAAENPGVIRYFRYTLLPDEMFFQTILAASPFRSRVTTREKGDISGNHFVTWADGKPEVLTFAHRERLSNAGPCFARKFREPVSAGLLDWIDEGLR